MSSRDSPQVTACPRQGLEDGPGSWHSGHFPVSLGSLVALAPLPASLLSDNSESRDKKMSLLCIWRQLHITWFHFCHPYIICQEKEIHRIQNICPRSQSCPVVDTEFKDSLSLSRAPSLRPLPGPEVPRFLRNQVATSGEGRTLRLWDPSLDWLYISIRGCAVCLVAQSCPTLCDPVDCSPPGSSIHGILQTRTREWVAMPSSRGSSQPRDQTQVSRIAGRFFTIWATRETSPWGYQEAKTCCES